MMLAVFLYPIVYCWYVAVPEMLYILYAGLRSAAYDGPAIFYFTGFIVYDVVCMHDPKTTMAVTAVLIAIDIYLHRGKTIRNALVDGLTSSSGRDRDDAITCPYCGSSDTDGNHCYTCGRDF